MEKAPERLKGFSIPDPINVLCTLRRYIYDALNGRDQRRFPAMNKTFLIMLGQPCQELLEYLGFRYEEEVSAASCTSDTTRLTFEREQEGDGFWNLPLVHASEEAPVYQDDLSILVDDVDKELMVLIDKRPWAERARSRTSVVFQPTASIKEFQRCLGYLNCEALKRITRTSRY